MACCALTVLIVGQLYFLVEAVAKRWGIAMPGDPKRSGAADWRPNDTVVVPEPRVNPAVAWLTGPRGRRLALVLTMSLTLLAGFVAGTVALGTSDASIEIKALLDDPASWCRSTFSVR